MQGIKLNLQKTPMMSHANCGGCPLAQICIGKKTNEAPAQPAEQQKMELAQFVGPKPAIVSDPPKKIILIETSEIPFAPVQTSSTNTPGIINRAIDLSLIEKSEDYFVTNSAIAIKAPETRGLLLGTTQSGESEVNNPASFSEYAWEKPLGQLHLVSISTSNQHTATAHDSEKPTEPKYDYVNSETQKEDKFHISEVKIPESIEYNAVTIQNNYYGDLQGIAKVSHREQTGPTHMYVEPATHEPSFISSAGRMEEKENYTDGSVNLTYEEIPLAKATEGHIENTGAAPKTPNMGNRPQQHPKRDSKKSEKNKTTEKKARVYLKLDGKNSSTRAKKLRIMSAPVPKRLKTAEMNPANKIKEPAKKQFGRFKSKEKYTAANRPSELAKAKSERANISKDDGKMRRRSVVAGAELDGNGRENTTIRIIGLFKARRERKKGRFYGAG